jgi:hypothetical protein
VVTKVEFEKSAEVVAIVGLFTSVTGTLVGAFFGQQIGAAGAEHERRNRQEPEESRQRAEDVARMALAHLDRDAAKEVLRASQKTPVNYWEIIANNLKKRGWSLGCISAVDSEGRTI